MMIETEELDEPSPNRTLRKRDRKLQDKIPTADLRNTTLDDTAGRLRLLLRDRPKPAPRMEVNRSHNTLTATLLRMRLDKHDHEAERNIRLILRHTHLDKIARQISSALVRKKSIILFVDGAC